jgi:hypothetical protein
MTIHLADGRDTVIDFREMAPDFARYPRRVRHQGAGLPLGALGAALGRGDAGRLCRPQCRARRPGFCREPGRPAVVARLRCIDPRRHRSPGARRIITTVLETIINIVDYGMAPQAAVEAPRLHFQGEPEQLFYEPFGLSPDTARC